LRIKQLQTVGILSIQDFLTNEEKELGPSPVSIGMAEGPVPGIEFVNSRSSCFV
jgi:hypothetical protein